MLNMDFNSEVTMNIITIQNEVIKFEINNTHEVLLSSKLPCNLL